MMLQALCWLSGIASLLLWNYGSNQAHSTLGLALSMVSVIAWCADMAAEKVIRNLKDKK
jgi:hypothetical protein